ncbi:hypothetical protein HAX54_047449 [Datura stramonium]|uniref:Uncharacterized protein n=1 Tax=Datura stramonium TaxID=4076 RepID=A0ABS8WI93_DATST|nr:hypothetical protein [Datura stramonium]
MLSLMIGNESSLSDNAARKGDASSRASSRSSNLFWSFPPRFSFQPWKHEPGLSRANSLGSARSFFASSERFSASIDEERQFAPMMPGRCYSNNLAFTLQSQLPDNCMDEPHTSSRRGLSAREPTERNISISRTLRSVDFAGRVVFEDHHLLMFVPFNGRREPDMLLRALQEEEKQDIMIFWSRVTTERRRRIRSQSLCPSTLKGALRTTHSGQRSCVYLDSIEQAIVHVISVAKELT